MTKYEDIPISKGTGHVKVCGECGAMVPVNHSLTHDVFHATFAVLVNEHMERAGANPTPLDGPLDKRWTPSPEEIATGHKPTEPV